MVPHLDVVTPCRTLAGPTLYLNNISQTIWSHFYHSVSVTLLFCFLWPQVIHQWPTDWKSYFVRASSTLQPSDAATACGLFWVIQTGLLSGMCGVHEEACWADPTKIGPDKVAPNHMQSGQSGTVDKCISDGETAEKNIPKTPLQPGSYLFITLQSSEFLIFCLFVCFFFLRWLDLIPRQAMARGKNNQGKKGEGSQRFPRGSFVNFLDAVKGTSWSWFSRSVPQLLYPFFLFHQAVRAMWTGCHGQICNLEAPLFALKDQEQCLVLDQTLSQGGECGIQHMAPCGTCIHWMRQDSIACNQSELVYSL